MGQAAPVPPHIYEAMQYMRQFAMDMMFNTFNEQGDIGLIIKKNGLGFLPGKIAPICLPAPDVYSDKNGFSVIAIQERDFSMF